MSLRVRLALAVLLTAVPAFACLAWLLADIEQRGRAAALRAYVVARMDNGGRERCEAEPLTFGGRQNEVRRRSGRGRNGRTARTPPRAPGAGRRARLQAELWAYGADFASVNPRAPAFPDALRRDLEDAGTASLIDRSQTPPRLLVAVRFDDDADSPCSVVLGLRPLGAAQDARWPGVLSAALVLGAALLAMLVAVGPVVARIRSLTEQVRRSAAERYARPVAVAGKDEVAQLAAAFNEAGAELRAHVEQLAEREQTLRAFLGNTTHDVMLPLTVLQGHLMTLRTAADQGRAADPGVLRAALDEAHYMASLVHNLGAAAKLDAGDQHLRRDPVDLGALVERVVARHRPVARLRGIAVEFATPKPSPVVAGDVTLLEQAVSNLVHNAVRYNHDDGHVAVVLEGDGEAFSLKVVDDGPGIAEDEVARLMERSYRGSAARSRHPDGHGLGLHIAQQVAARHGFTLELRRSEYDGLEAELRYYLDAATGITGRDAPNR